MTNSAKRKPSTVMDDFAVGTGTNRHKVLKKLIANEGKAVSIDALCKAVYGDPDYRGPLRMVFKGLGQIIETKRLPWRIIKAKDQGGITYTLRRARK